MMDWISERIQAGQLFDHDKNYSCALNLLKNDLVICLSWLQAITLNVCCANQEIHRPFRYQLLLPWQRQRYEASPHAPIAEHAFQSYVNTPK